MLSWLGSLGILLFFLWHIAKFRKEVSFVRHSIERISPILRTLISERGDIDQERFMHDSEKGATLQDKRHASSNIRIDTDDLEKLDGEMGKIPMLHTLWLQYRMTLILEHVPWFMEARIFSTKRAEEIFTQETTLANQVNVAFYRQFPSLLTSIGLLLTFVALFIGLGKLHAEGNEIVGIQGLINGLAGKFLTSIVGLIAANMFTFFEKPLMADLMHTHYSFLRLLDQLFPRKTIEQMLEHIASRHHNEPVTMTPRNIRNGAEMKGLAAPLANLTSVVQSLTRLHEDQHAETCQTISELPHMIREELQTPLRELTDTIHDLAKVLQDKPTEPTPNASPFKQRPFLWENSSDVMNPFATIHPRKTRSWPKWPRFSTKRKTG